MNDERTTSTWRRAIVPAAIAIAIGAVVALSPQPTIEMTPDSTTAPTTVRLAEDDPGWECETMGNRICGEES